MLDRDYAAAEEGFRRAQELGPSEIFRSLIDVQFGFMYLRQGKPEAALSRLRMAARADPFHDYLHTLMGMGNAETMRGNYPAAVELFNRAFNATGGRADDFPTWILLYRSYACYLMQDSACANQSLDKAWELYGTRRPEWFPGVLAALGRVGQARKILADIEERAAAGDYVNAEEAFLAYYHLGDLDKAFVWLERAIDDREDVFYLLRSPIHFTDLHDDPRFQQALKHLQEIETWPAGDAPPRMAGMLDRKGSDIARVRANILRGGLLGGLDRMLTAGPRATRAVAE